MSMEEEDRWVWAIDPSDVFSVKSILRSIYSLGQEDYPPYALAWNKKVPPKIQVFLWAALRGRILIRCNLRSQCLLPEGVSELCVLCEEGEESVDHLLSACPYATGIWCLFINLTECPWAMNTTIGKTVIQWKGGPFVRRRRVAWSLILAAIMWAIWKERNTRIFLGKSGSTVEVFEKAKWNLAC